MFNLAIFLAEICLILTATRLTGLIFKKINQPQIIGEMTAGILLGPSLLGWLAPEITSMLFPPGSLDYLYVVSQVGLLLYMFIIGLKLDTKLLFEQKYTAILTSLTSIISPFFLGFLLASYLYPKLSDDKVSLATFSLFMGVSMSVTAFPVLARILSERNLLHTRVGTVAITCAAVDDITAWLLLAAITAYTQSFKGLSQLEVTLGGLALYFGVMWLVLRPGLRRLQDRYHNKGQLTPGMTTFILLLLFGSALITERLSVHALFGAFFAGCIMPKDERLLRDLLERIEHITGVLLLPIFFALTGMRTNIRLASTAEVWFYCGLILVVAVAGKLGGSMLSARLTGMSWREAGAIGVLMNTRGLMELIILNIGLELGVISSALFSIMVLMALVTTIMTAPLLAWIYPTRLSSRDR